MANKLFSMEHQLGGVDSMEKSDTEKEKQLPSPDMFSSSLSRVVLTGINEQGVLCHNKEDKVTLKLKNMGLCWADRTYILQLVVVEQWPSQEFDKN
ncbi:hypothetical protein Y1Q_0000113 [Alligator mississippiensis]|uniref:Uncharacterized protein n=1 Tax=Alligator mississippiensis TaxID=8496 RepID=A0A151NQI1_ALLMI|nr:hypothetical protein Y1Q_0000113 [Alligator mississippiensis]